MVNERLLFIFYSFLIIFALIDKSALQLVLECGNPIVAVSFACVLPVYSLIPFCLSQVELEVTLPGEGRDRVFLVAIKYVAQVSLFALDEALEGRNQQIPLDAIQAIDVVMRHLSSMT